MMLVQLFLLSMVKTSGATRDGCDGYYRRGVESYLNCQIYLMKWTVAAYWLIGIGVLIFAFTVSRISYKEKIISYILRLIFLIHHHVKILYQNIFCLSLICVPPQVLYFLSIYIISNINIIIDFRNCIKHDLFTVNNLTKFNNSSQLRQQTP